ncbi:uncharacterized protein [Aristolochia californica]|uniref:uncharacterized protein n=1 Tax=Aristolochia californica TaxID=171875 RepID=UPI0035D907B0
MSRCFPFPPPGYEKKAKDDVADLLAKEKNKEKKHKKEKKEREKKDKKDKERSKDKHKDKKDRKEKHKSKDKKRDKDKDKDKGRTADEKKIEGRIESHNGEKTGETNRRAEELKNSKVLEELGKRIRNEGAAADQVVDCVITTDQRRTEGAILPSEKFKEKEGEDRRQHRHRDREDYRGTGNQMAHSLVGQERRKQEGMGKPMEKQLEKKGEGKEKSNEREGDDKRENKHRDRDREDKKRKDRDKEKEKEKEKVKEKLEKGEQKHKEHDKLKESSKKDQVGTFNINKPLLKNGEKNAVNEEKPKKRKEFEMNGFLHENDIQPNKLPRQSSSSHPPMENGRKLEANHVRIPCASDRQGAPVGKKVETNKEHKVNGVIENVSSSIGLRLPLADAHPSSNNLRPLPLTVEACENGEVSSTKPPHPDVKYLSQIYSIPKMDEWIDFGDDQEWLLGGEKSRRQEAKVEHEVVETGVARPLVWADAMQIESADICALPYVIPH